MTRRIVTLSFLAVLLFAAPARAQFISDSFTDNGGIDTLLSDHSPEIGGAWIEHGSLSGLIYISPVQDYLKGDSNYTIYYNATAPPGADYNVQCTFDIVANNVASYGGCVGRVDTVSDTMYRAWYDATISTWNLDKVINGGAAVSLGTYVQTLTDSQLYVLELEMIGTAIKVYIDGVERICANSCAGDASISSAGRAGVFQVSNTGQQITAFSANDEGAPPAGGVSCTSGAGRPPIGSLGLGGAGC